MTRPCAAPSAPVDRVSGEPDEVPSMMRSLLLVFLSLGLAACASGSKPPPSWWQSLDDADAPVEDAAVSCRGVKSGDELDRLVACRPLDAPRLSPMDVGGLEVMRAELRECALAGLPAPGAEGGDQAGCQRGLAE